MEPSKQSEAKNSEAKNWPILYYIIGSVNFAIIAIAFYGMHLFLKHYETLLLERDNFSTFFTQIITVKDAGTALNQPGNSIFQSHNTAAEMQRLTNYENKFQLLYDELYNHWIQLSRQKKNNPIVQQHIRKIGENLKGTHAHAQKMIEKAKQVLIAYEKNQKDLAGVYMAEMDHYFLEFSELSSVNLLLGRDIESGFLQQEKAFLQLSEKRKIQFSFLLILVFIYSILLSEKTRKAIYQKQQVILESESRLKAVMDAAADGIVTIDQKGIILSTNPKFIAIFGYSEEELIGKNISMLVTPSHQPKHDHYLENYLNTKQSKIIGHGREVEGLKKSGEIFPVDLAVSPLILENSSQFVGITRDISERKANEKKLFSYSKNLSEKVSQLESAHLQLALQAEELHHAKMKADDALVSKSQFLAAMSHEIRTPMNAMIGFCKLLKKTSLDMDQQDKVKRIEGASEHLLGIINDILDFSKIEAGKMQIESAPFSLRDEMRNVLEMYYSAATEKGLLFFAEINPTVPDRRIGDALRLRQILMNLISNAIKFTSSGHLRLSITAIRTDELLICLQDTGIGMNAEQQSRLFQPFTQADGSTARQFGGTGLGLNISKQLTELMHGTITLKSTLGEGSTFSVSLVLPTDTHQTISTPPIFPKNLNPIQLLITNPDEKELLKRTLSHAGFTTIEDSENKIENREKNIEGNENNADAQHSASQRFFARIIDIYHIMQTSIAGDQIPTILIQANNQSSAALTHKALLLKPPYFDIDLFNLLTDILHKDHAPISITNVMSEHILRTDALINKRCLLVEDNENNQILAQCLLEEMGLLVSIAQNGLEAIDQLKKNSFDIILMDMQMPIMDGLTATQKIRHELNIKTPILAMTANAMAEDKRKCTQAGMNDHISKPIAFEILKQKLTDYLSASQTPETNLITPEQQTPITLLEPSLATTTNTTTTNTTTTNTTTMNTTTISPTTPNTLDTAILDTEGALARISHKKQLYQKILRRFTEDYAKIDDQLNSLIINQQYEEAARFAHTLKGVAGTVGAVQVQESASLLEKKIIRHESTDVLTQDIAQCQVYTTAAIEHSRVYLSQ